MLSPLKAPTEEPTAPTPPTLNLNPGVDVAGGAATVGASEVELGAGAEGTAKEKRCPDGAAGRADGAEKEKAGVDFTTGAGAAAGAGTGEAAVEMLASAGLGIESSEGFCAV